MRSPKRARLTLPPQSVTTPSGYQGRVVVLKLCDEVLLKIFRYYLDASPRLWPRLVHICRKWRRVVFASQRTLHLRLFCVHGTPVVKALDCWPALPIVVEYGRPPALGPPAPEDEDNIIAAFKKSDRVSSIGLTVTSSLLEKLPAVERPFSALEDLVLLPRDNVPLILPSTFLWGSRLRTLHLTRAAIPTLPQLLSHSKGLIDLQLHKIPNVGYFPPEAFASALSGMTHLQTLSLHFLSFTPRRQQDYLGLPPPSGERVVLPALTHFKYRGTSRYLDNLVFKIGAPRLEDIDITFFGRPPMYSSQLGRFISQIEMQKSHRQAVILSTERAISISFTQPGQTTRFGLQVSCRKLALQLSYMAEICNDLSAFLLGVEDLRIGATQLPSQQNDSDHEEWLDLIRPFGGAKWVHVAGNHSTNVVLALDSRYSRTRRGAVLPTLHKLCIQEPKPHYAPFQEAVVSFIRSRRLLGHGTAVEYERPCINELRGTGPISQLVTTKMLPDDVLLHVFRHHLHASPRSWPELAHVCQGWRRIIFTSTLGLDLRLYCTYGTPVLKTLEYWPPLPLVLNYGGSPMLGPPAPEDDVNIMAALEHSDRIGSISLTISKSLLESLPTISEPFSELEQLILLSRDNVQLTFPSAFRSGPRLRTLHLTRIVIPALPQLLSSSTGLVDLQLHEIPIVGYFSPEAFADALSGMTHLRILSLHFLSFLPRRNFLGLPPPPEERVVLPALTRLKYRGTSKYLDNLVARIDAPHLGDIDITFFSQPTMDASQLGRFIDRIELLPADSYPRADVSTSESSISISISHPNAPTRLELRVLCEQLDWQVSSMAQICGHFSPFLFRIERLDFFDETRPSSKQGDMDGEQWLELIRTFGGAKDFYVGGEYTIDILRALDLADGEHPTDITVLPALRDLHVPPYMVRGEPSWDAAQPFIASRRLSGRVVKLAIREDLLW